MALVEVENLAATGDCGRLCCWKMVVAATDTLREERRGFWVARRKAEENSLADWERVMMEFCCVLGRRETKRYCRIYMLSPEERWSREYVSSRRLILATSPEVLKDYGKGSLIAVTQQSTLNSKLSIVAADNY